MSDFIIDFSCLGRHIPPHPTQLAELLDISASGVEEQKYAAFDLFLIPLYLFIAELRRF